VLLQTLQLHQRINLLGHLIELSEGFVRDIEVVVRRHPRHCVGAIELVGDMPENGIGEPA